MVTPHLQYVKYVLADSGRWTKSISGRPNDVPKPAFTLEGDDTKLSLRTEDYIEIEDGGVTSITPQSVGWDEEKRQRVVSVDIRTATRRVQGTKTDGRIRMYGERGGGTLNANEAPRWGGVAGEASRVLHEVRDRDQEFDVVETFEARDLSGELNPGHYRVVLEVELTQQAYTIDTST